MRDMKHPLPHQYGITSYCPRYAKTVDYTMIRGCLHWLRLRRRLCPGCFGGLGAADWRGESQKG